MQRNGYADKVFIITSGENMAIHAAANIAMAVDNFKNRGYAQLGGIILNRRDVPREEEKVAELADDFHTKVIGTLSHSEQVAMPKNNPAIMPPMISVFETLIPIVFATFSLHPAALILIPMVVWL